MAKYISKLINDEELYYLKDAEARASLNNKTGADDFENLGYVVTIQTVDDAIAEANKEDSVISFDTDTANVNEGETLTKAVTVTAGNGAVTYTSSNTNVAIVNTQGVVTGISAGTCTITANIASTSSYRSATASYTVTVVYNPYGGHDYVEIAGIKWATMNIGANSVTDTGLYFQWGDTQGYTREQCGTGEGQKYFGWADYKYGDGSSDYDTVVITKYNNTDNKQTLEASDDAARANWGGSWRMPTDSEITSLSIATTASFTEDYNGSGVKGFILTDKTDSSKVLFFPAAGNCYEGENVNINVLGRYWSSSVTGNKTSYMINSTTSEVQWHVSVGRNSGLSIRPVAD